MMKRLSVVFVGALATIGFSTGFATNASADATVDLVWFSTSNTDPAAMAGVGTSAIKAASGDQLGLEIRLTAGTEGLSSWGVSLEFDGDLLNELNVPGGKAGTTEYGLAPTITCTPFPSCFFGTPTMVNLNAGISGVVESVTGAPGYVFTFEAGTLGNGVSASFGSFKIGEVLFSVNPSVATDGPDISSGFFNTGADGAFDNAGLPVTMHFNSAAVDAFAPEPGVAALLGLGLLGLTLAGRRARK